MRPPALLRRRRAAHAACGDKPAEKKGAPPALITTTQAQSACRWKSASARWARWKPSTTRRSAAEIAGKASRSSRCAAAKRSSRAVAGADRPDRRRAQAPRRQGEIARLEALLAPAGTPVQTAERTGAEELHLEERARRGHRPARCAARPAWPAPGPAPTSRATPSTRPRRRSPSTASSKTQVVASRRLRQDSATRCSGWSPTPACAPTCRSRNRRGAPQDRPAGAPLQPAAPGQKPSRRVVEDIRPTVDRRQPRALKSSPGSKPRPAARRRLGRCRVVTGRARAGGGRSRAGSRAAPGRQGRLPDR
jgi:hypothetical protein